MQEKNTVGQKTTVIQAYDLVGLLQEVQKATLEGYRIDLQSTENFPRQIGTAYLLGMVKVDVEEVKGVQQEGAVEASEEIVEVEKVGKQRGRQAKGT